MFRRRVLSLIVGCARFDLAAPIPWQGGENRPTCVGMPDYQSCGWPHVRQLLPCPLRSQALYYATAHARCYIERRMNLLTASPGTASNWPNSNSLQPT